MGADAVLASPSMGVCWVFGSFWLDCFRHAGARPPLAQLDALQLRSLQVHQHTTHALAWNLIRTASVNPRTPLCILTSSSREAVLADLRAEPGASRWIRKLEPRIDVVHVPCATPPSPAGPEQRAAGGGRRAAAGAQCPTACEVSQRYGPSWTDAPAQSKLRKKLAEDSVVRYARLIKTRTLAHVPYPSTLVLDTDVALCSGVRSALGGVADAMAARAKFVGVRLFSRAEKGLRARNARDFEQCDRACGNASDAAREREQMRCKALCADAHAHTGARGCRANTGVMLVRRSAEAAEFARVWFARYWERMVRLDRKRRSKPDAPLKVDLLDQSTFGSSGLHAADERARACKSVANIPRHLHLARSEVHQEERVMRGRAIGVHGCKSHGRNGSECSLYTACCERVGKCADVSWEF